MCRRRGFPDAGLVERRTKRMRRGHPGANGASSVINYSLISGETKRLVGAARLSEEAEETEEARI